MLHLSSARPSRVVAIDSLTICPETSVAEALGCCRAINERYLCSEAPFYLGFGVVPIAFMMLAELLLHNKAARS